MFFFVGFFLVYLAFGTTRRIGIVYASESNIVEAMDTSTMVIMLTLMLFLFMFVIELLFYVINTWKRNIEQKGEPRKI